MHGAGGAHAFVGVEGVGFAGVEIFGEETNFAFERTDKRFYLLVERTLGLCNNRTDQQDEKK